MIRRQHFLRGNKSRSLPNAAIWVDTETHERRVDDVTVEHRLTFGMACYQRTRTRNQWCAPEWLRFTKANDFWDFVDAHIRPNVRLYVFAHNWSFDAPVLGAFHLLPSRGWKLTKCIVESPPVILTFTRDSNSMTLLDTLNWWRMPLASIGKSVGLDKLTMPKRGASRAQWDTYARRDVEIIRVATLEWFDFLDTYDLGSYAPTLASQALRAFRHRFMSHDILIDDNTEALKLARESIHGGRVEAFKLGRVAGPIHVLDVNSMYPAVMRDNDYPTVLTLHARNPTLDELSRWSQKHAVIARCRIKTDRPRFAITRDHRVIFPVGRFHAELATPDIVDALEHGEIESASEANVYTKAPIFRSFVEDLYELRRAATASNQTVRSWLLKILMNSLYGKFAQRGTVWEMFGDAADLSVKVWREIDAETGDIRDFRQFAGIVQTKLRDPESRESHPAIASHVTAYARANLWRLMQIAKLESVVYCDTDSLFVTTTGIKRLEGEIDPLNLGRLKHEATHDWVVIHGLKDYQTPTKTVVKGVKAQATWTGPNEVLQEQWQSLPGAIRQSDLDAPKTTTVRKVLSRRYLKGQVERSGDVLPLSLSEW